MTYYNMDEIYKSTAPENIPWNIETPPAELAELVDSRKITACRAIDLGCGTGNYAIYLAGKGFQITGVDFAHTAIKIARENAAKKSVKCKFVVADVTGKLAENKNSFDFAYDWGMLHHIFPENRKKYVENVYSLLHPKGKYLSVCFSVEDSCFEGSGKYRKTQMGTELYFSSEDEMKKLFEPRFTILDLKTIDIYGKFDAHRAVYVFMEKNPG